MLDRIDVSEGIDANKTIESKECDNFHCFFLKIKNLNCNHIYAIDVMIY